MSRFGLSFAGTHQDLAAGRSWRDVAYETIPRSCWMMRVFYRVQELHAQALDLHEAAIRQLPPEERKKAERRRFDPDMRRIHDQAVQLVKTEDAQLSPIDPPARRRHERYPD